MLTSSIGRNHLTCFRINFSNERPFATRLLFLLIPVRRRFVHISGTGAFIESVQNSHCSADITTPHYVEAKTKIKFIVLYFSPLDYIYPSEDSRIVRECTVTHSTIF